MLRTFAIGWIWLLLPFLGNAQIERSLFAAFEVDSISQIKVNLRDSAKVEFWPGDNILVESNIAFYNGTKTIFEQLLKKKRYNLIEKRQGDILVLEPNPDLQQKITAHDGTVMDEIIERTIYIPESFVFSNGTYIKAKEEPDKP